MHTSYEAKNDDELSLRKGSVVKDILQTDREGWHEVRSGQDDSEMLVWARTIPEQRMEDNLLLSPKDSHVWVVILQPHVPFLDQISSSLFTSVQFTVNTP